MTTEQAYAYGSPRILRYSTRNHVLVVDHRYGPFSEFAYGTTLCGLRLTMTARSQSLATVTGILLSDPRGCRRCARVAR